MKITNQSSFVEFEFKEFQNIQGWQDISCQVEVYCEEFGGKVNSVWFSHENTNSFIEQLISFDKYRKGSVELFNESSGSDANPLEFRIFATDSLGHLAVRATLRKLVHFKDSYEISIISVIFEIDAGALRLVIDDFKKLFVI